MNRPITKAEVEGLAGKLRTAHGGVKEDYFGVLYLERTHGLSREAALDQTARGNNDYGVDGFHFDRERRTLYLYQFKFSDDCRQFVPSMRRLIEDGLERIFVTTNKDPQKNPVLIALRHCLWENRSIIDQVMMRFVFTGSIEDVELSAGIEGLQENLHDRSNLVASFFGDRKVPFVVSFVSTTEASDPRSPTPVVCPVSLGDCIVTDGPSGQRMHVGFVPLEQLVRMYGTLGNRFLHQNIRFGLGVEGAVNKAIQNAIKAVVVDKVEDPRVFAFNHNGITLYASEVRAVAAEDVAGATHELVEPRLLNGAQTVTTAAGFLERRKGPDALDASGYTAFAAIRVLCRIVTSGEHAFVTRVTINNNRQNPVEPWNLRANDLIQRQLQDKFRVDLGIYYERQKNAFEMLQREDLDEGGIVEDSSAVELLKLAQTFVVTDGNISRLSELRKVFEEDTQYGQAFRESRLKADTRHILLCYKAMGRTRVVTRAILDKGPNQYWYAMRARSLIWGLLCQAILNDDDLDDHAEAFGRSMRMHSAFTDLLVGYGEKKVRHLLRELLQAPEYRAQVDQDKLSFLRTDNAFRRCMGFAKAKWDWSPRKLG